VIGVIGALLAVTVLSRELARAAVPTLVGWSDGDERRLVAIVLAMWAALPLFILGAARAHVRAGWWAAAPFWLLTGVVGLFLFGFVPGKGDDGDLARQLDLATPGLDGSGDVLTGAALGGFLTVVVASLVQAVPVLLLSWRGRDAPMVVLLGLTAAVYVAVWVVSGVLTIAAVGATSDSRGDWLADTADALRGGDAGVTGGFDVGLDPTVVELVDCDTAASVLRVDGDAPELDGCRGALLVAATGRYDLDGVRTSSGALSAVVVQVRTEDQVSDLLDTLDDAELRAAAGLPAPTGTTLAGAARAALSVVVSAEDTGAVPLPADPAGRRPLTRALAYVVLGTALGIYVAPPAS
jgi:hypothetical protein